MVGRLISLLVVAGAAGLGAVFVSRAQAEKSPTAARIPGIPAVEALSGTRCPIPPRLRPAFVEASIETRLPLALLTAVAQVESGSDTQRPIENVLAGARFLRAQFDRFRSNDRALAAYQAAPAAVTDRGAASGESLTYVADVTAVWRALAGCG